MFLKSARPGTGAFFVFPQKRCEHHKQGADGADDEHLLLKQIDSLHLKKMSVNARCPMPVFCHVAWVLRPILFMFLQTASTSHMIYILCSRRRGKQRAFCFECGMSKQK